MDPKARLATLIRRSSECNDIQYNFDKSTSRTPANGYSKNVERLFILQVNPKDFRQISHWFTSCTEE